MILSSAPDPRDILWDNATVEKQTLVVKNVQCTLLLSASTILWFSVIVFIGSVTDEFSNLLPENSDWEKQLKTIIDDFIPPLLLELCTLIIPFTLNILAKKFIRFKTHSGMSRNDQYFSL